MLPVMCQDIARPGTYLPSSASNREVSDFSLSIYAQLVTLLGPQDFLAAVIRMLLDQRGPKAQKNESLLDKDSFGLPMRLLDHFPVSVRLVVSCALCLVSTLS